MEKNTKTEILKLELVRIKSILNDIVNSTSNGSLEKRDLLEYMDNLNRIAILNSQIANSVKVGKERAKSALKVLSSKQEKSYFIDDPDSIELQKKLDKLYKLATENKSSKDENV